MSKSAGMSPAGSGGGLVGPQGPPGPQGAAGSPGAAGPAGANGATIVYGTTDPPSAAVGNNGDWYVYTVFGLAAKIFGPKAGGAWPANGAPLVGPQGPAGAAGAAGADGAQGPQGIQGVAGPQGPQGPAGPAGGGGTTLKSVFAGLATRAAGVHFGTSDDLGAGGELRAGTWSGGGNVRAVVHSAVGQFDWADLEPTERGNWDFSAIDQFFTNAQTYGVTACRFRIFCGFLTPSWILDANSNRLAIPHWYSDEATPANKHYGTSAASGDAPADGITKFWAGAAFAGTDYGIGNPTAGGGSPINGAMPRWWEPEYVDHYFRLMSEIARRYDTETLLKDVQISATQTIYGEPLIRQLHARSGDSNTKPNKNRIETPGWQGALAWSEDKDFSAIKASIDAHAAAFRQTRSVLCCSPMQRFGSTRTGDVQATFEIVAYAQGKLGFALVRQQNSVQDPRQSGSTDWYTAGGVYDHLYSEFTAAHGAGHPLSFQTQPLSVIGGASQSIGLKFTLDDSIAMGAHAVELPAGYSNVLTQAEATTRDTNLRANVVP